MEQWFGKVAVVTGASSGIGAETTLQLAMAGMIVIGLARRPELIDSLNNQLLLFSNSSNISPIYSHYCDVTKLDTISKAFNWIDQKFGRIDVLVNAAGIGRINLLLDSSVNPNSEFELQNVINTNLMGTIYTTRAAFEIMRRQNDYGHIVGLQGSWAFKIPNDPNILTFLNTYPASKRALSAMADVIRKELDSKNNTKIKYTNVSPNWVKTDIVNASGYELAEEFYNTIDYLWPKDIVDGILYILGTPRHVLIEELSLSVIGGK